MDERFVVEVISRSPFPQTTIYMALHQDYSEDFVSYETPPVEEKCGTIAVTKLLKGNKGHYGCLEHPQITFNVGYFPHSVMQQGRTHRISSWDVQSMRYSGKRICDVVDGKRDIEDVFYLRPIGHYHDRFGKKYEYTEAMRQDELERCLDAAKHYKQNIDYGMAEEHARSLIPFDFRQHFVVSFNMRSLMHFLTIRGKKDAQLEIQQLCELMLPHFQDWAPEIYAWFMENQWLKGALAP